LTGLWWTKSLVLFDEQPVAPLLIGLLETIRR
jgi:hypothetical protein